VTPEVTDRETGRRAAIAAGQSMPAATGMKAILASPGDAPTPVDGG
jgi:hypothetical protein